MTDLPDIRWKQRFQNFTRALGRLSEALKNGPDSLSELEQEGAIRRFEYSYELGWKTLKDFLQHSGITISPVTPKQVFKAAFAAQIIDSEKVWVDMLNHRNLVAHDYDEEEFAAALAAVYQHYLPELNTLRKKLENQS